MTTTVNIPDYSHTAREQLRHVMRTKYQGNFNKKLDPNLKRELQHGWLLSYIGEIDRLLWGRWDYWAQCNVMPEHAYSRLKMEPALALIENRPIEALPKFVIEETLPKEPIPQITWEYSASVSKMLDRTLDGISNSSTWRSWGSCWDYIRYFLKWAFYGLGHPKQPELPPEPRHCEGASMRLYQLFDAGLMLLFPEDYWGRLIPEITSKSSQQASGFYPTPLHIMEFMTQIVSTKEDDRASSFYEPCVGTGSAMLAMSNHCLSGVGQDIDPLLLDCALFQMYLYAPWMAVPIWWLGNTDLLLGNSLSAEIPTSINAKYWYQQWGDSDKSEDNSDTTEPLPTPVEDNPVPVELKQSSTPVAIEKLPPDPQVAKLVKSNKKAPAKKQLNLFDMSAFTSDSPKQKRGR
ncbi:MAG: hypothetical protein WBB28_05125 [Crinalium sp.]